MPIILSRHGRYDERDNVSPEEARRVGWIVRDMAWAQGINLKVAEIITSDTPRTKQTARGIAEVNGIKIPQEGFPFDTRIFEGYPGYGDWQVSPEIRWAMILVREKIHQLWPDKPLIIVGHLPSFWGIWSQLEPENFPPYATENDSDIGELIPYGSVAIFPSPKV